jgi:hypothetical protein
MSPKGNESTKRKEREIGSELAHEPLTCPEYASLSPQRDDLRLCQLVERKDEEERGKRRHDELAGN